MLHIILGILKIIGIILGILLLLLLAIILAVLFVPVRYRLEAQKQDGRLGAEMRISWLLRILSVNVALDAGGRPDITARLFGICLPLFGKTGLFRKFGRRRKKGRPGGDGKMDGDRDYRSRDALRSDRTVRPERNDTARLPEISVEPDPAGQMAENLRKDNSEEAETENILQNNGSKTEEMRLEDAEPEHGQRQEEQEPEHGQRQEEQEPEKEQEQEAEPEKEQTREEQEKEPEKEQTREEQEQEAEPEKEQTREEQVKEPKEKKAEKIIYKTRRIYDKIKNIAAAVKRFFARLLSLPAAIERLTEKIAELFRKPGELLALAEDYEIKEIIAGAFGYLKYLLRHYGPCRIQGYLRFGTGDPALTGQLAGLMYLILPAKADRFVLTPEFNETVFETEVVCRGHIRACHLAYVGWRVFRDKKVRRLIRAIRKPQG